MENEEPDMNNIKLLEKISAKEVLLRDRVRRKLLILKKRPNTRNKLIRIANRSGRTSKLKPSELLDIIKRNGITLSEIESDWLILYLDPNRLNQLYVEDLLSLLEISGSAEYDSHYSNNSNNGDTPPSLRIPRHLLQNEDEIILDDENADQSVNGTKYQRYTEKQLNEIAKLELEMQDLMSEIARAEDETAWWEHQKEWEEATVRSVVSRRARLQKTQKKLINVLKKLHKLKKIYNVGKIELLQSKQ